MLDATSAPVVEPTKEATIKPTNAGSSTNAPVGGGTTNAPEASQPPSETPGGSGEDVEDKDDDKEDKKKETSKPGLGLGRS
jgi:hypothetical protein